jgi:ubiquinone/menaquinone biosynthesis C-methylase UbiE
MKQQKVWDNIAQEWFEFKTNPSENVMQFLKKQKGKVLDLGSGAGRHLTNIKNGKMYLIDFSKEMIKLARQKNIDAEFAVADLTKIPYEDDFFDGGICIASLHCIKGDKNREKAVKELFRVLKPKAQVFIAVWNKDSKRFKNAPKEKFVKWRNKGERYYYLYNKKEIHDLFKKIGFKIIKEISHNVNIEFIVEKP